MDNEQDLELDNEEGLDDLEGSDTTDTGGEGAPPSTDNDGSEPESKRINDLMSKWQTSEAENARLKRQLAKIAGGQATKRTPKTSDIDEFREFAREDARQRLHAREPRFAKYGIEASAITGDTIEEMRASFTAQVKVIDGLESKIRGEVLKEHGFDLDVGGSGAESALPDFDKMTPEEFAKFVEKRDGLL